MANYTEADDKKYILDLKREISRVLIDLKITMPLVKISCFSWLFHVTELTFQLPFVIYVYVCTIILKLLYMCIC